jgi:ribonuclease HII
MDKHNLQQYYLKNSCEAGLDEAGRGCIAGPVYAAAVILPENINIPLLNDSKQLTEKRRYELRKEIEEKALAWAIAWQENTDIDKINILQASIKAMHLAIDKLKLRPSHLIIDGNKFNNYRKIPHQCIIKGDSHYYSIAAASVLAKTYRDDHMNRLHNEYEIYHWKRNKGYGTQQHREAIIEHGISPYHRRSFNIHAYQLKLNLFKNGKKYNHI